MSYVDRVSGAEAYTQFMFQLSVARQGSPDFNPLNRDTLKGIQSNSAGQKRMDDGDRITQSSLDNIDEMREIVGSPVELYGPKKVGGSIKGSVIDISV